MLYDRPKWKSDWEQARDHHLQWWRQEGMVLTIAGLLPLEPPRDLAPRPPEPQAARERHTDPDWFAWSQRLSLAAQPYPADNLPIAHIELGCVQMAAYFGAEPEFDERTVWYGDVEREPDAYPALVLTKDEPWWRAYKQMMLKAVEVSRGDYLVGMPAFGSNLDVLAELRGTQNLLYDLVDRPDWVHDKLEQINQAFFTAFDDYYAHIRLADGSSAYTYFQLWGPGKVSQVQCDFSAMISPAMFETYVVPPLQRQCVWLDHSLYHLDGPHCICHLDALLAIPELDAVQWTPGAGQLGAGNAMWYGLYERILRAHKSVQILGASVPEAKRILETFGSKGVYLSVNVDSKAEADEIMGVVEAMRRDDAVSTQVRKALAGDIEHIQAIARRTIDANYRSFLGDEGVDSFIESGASDQYIVEHTRDCWVLVVDGRIKGFCVPAANLIDLLMIDHDVHRQGYGTLLLRHCEEQLFREYDQLKLESFAGNDKANSFYRKNGWAEKDRVFDEASSEVKLVFVKGCD